MASSAGVSDVELAFVSCFSIQRLGVYHGLDYRTAVGEGFSGQMYLQFLLCISFAGVAPVLVESTGRLLLIASNMTKIDAFYKHPTSHRSTSSISCKVGPGYLDVERRGQEVEMQEESSH